MTSRISETIRKIVGRSEFTDMQNVEARGTLDYGSRSIGEKSITASSFGDSGDLYPKHITQHWTAPSKERIKKL